MPTPKLVVRVKRKTLTGMPLKYRQYAYIEGAQKLRLSTGWKDKYDNNSSPNIVVEEQVHNSVEKGWSREYDSNIILLSFCTYQLIEKRK